MLHRCQGQGQPRGGETLTLQGIDKGTGDDGFVFDNQNVGHGIRALGIKPERSRLSAPRVNQHSGLSAV